MLGGFMARSSRPEAGIVQFNPIVGFEIIQGIRPVHRTFQCGACGDTTNGRVLCSVNRKSDNANVSWCACSCEREEPTVIAESDGTAIMQIPIARKFHASGDWPKELADLYEEAAKCFAAGAYTASSMVCRKALMACVCHEQDKAKVTVKEGESFAYYVDYLTNTILTFAAAKGPLDAIRSIGNDANHHVQFVVQAEADRSMNIVWHLFNTIYSFTGA
jgi:hypothetical protein